MLTTTAGIAQHPSRLDRLAAAPVRSATNEIDWHTPIDRSRWFFCETLTPLYYCRIYRDLDHHHQRRYNQLTAMMANEIIAFMESEFLVTTLTAVTTHLKSHESSDLRAAVIRFADDERRHAGIWWELNRLSEPAWYQERSWRLINIPPGVLSIARFIARHPVAFPLVFWLQLVQEERSLEISRRCMRLPLTSIEPRYLAAYGAHLPDEARHVQIDRYLIDRYYCGRHALVRHTSASLMKTIVRTLLLTPVHSTMRVVRILAAEYPRLAPLVPRIRRELEALNHSREYHEMMYSRSTTPVTFALFDEHPEFHAMREVLLAYEPRY